MGRYHYYRTFFKCLNKTCTLHNVLFLGEYWDCFYTDKDQIIEICKKNKKQSICYKCKKQMEIICEYDCN